MSTVRLIVPGYRVVAQAVSARRAPLLVSLLRRGRRPESVLRPSPRQNYQPGMPCCRLPVESCWIHGISRPAFAVAELATQGSSTGLRLRPTSARQVAGAFVRAVARQRRKETGERIEAKHA